ncbi:hypothetical protein OROGR_010021 [Orobanche gracilis]
MEESVDGTVSIFLEKVCFICRGRVFLVQFSCGVKLTLDLNPAYKSWQIYNEDVVRGRIFCMYPYGCRDVQIPRSLHDENDPVKRTYYALTALDGEDRMCIVRGGISRRSKHARVTLDLVDLFPQNLLASFNFVVEENKFKFFIPLFTFVYHHPKYFQLSEEQVRNLALFEMEKILASNNYSLKDWKSMPFPDEFVIPDIRNRFIHDEISYDKDAMNNEHSVLYSKLTDEQRGVYHKIMSVVDRGRGGVFFLYGYGGTGKTSIWKTLCSKLRGRGDIVLPVASSGFASLLLPRGRTAHSRFSIPLDVHEESFCPGLSPGTDLSELLKRTKLIVWDEAPMTNKHCFEALDRSLKDIIRSPSGQSSQMPFGGLVVVFGGDFRQILPVVQMGSRYDIVHATITSSKIWESCEVLQLTRNMRLQGGSSPSEVEEIKNFAEWLLEVGNGTLGGENDGEADIKLPDDIIIKDAKDPIASIVESTYPSILQNMSDPKFFQERAILAPTNEMVEKINEYISSLMPGEEVEYLSSDCISKEEGEVNEHEHIYSTEFLNTVRCSGLPNHSLKLKVGCMVMLLRNIDQGAELCNGTRLIGTKLGKLVVEAKMLTGKYAEEMVYIPRTIMSPTDFTKFPVKFQRRQFPLAVYFAMTINKSQGQSLTNVGLYLPKLVFSHGQLYVAFSRVTTKKGLKVLAYDKDGNISDTTTNVVYREIFNKL